MGWTAPITRSVNDVYTAAQWNTHIRDNLIFLHDTHGPLWLPAQMWTRDAAHGPSNLIGTNPDSYAIINFANSIDINHIHLSMLVPDDWIAGGFEAKVYWTPSGTDTGDCRFELDYLFISAGGNPEAAGTTITQDIAGGGSATALQIDTIGTTAAPTAGQWMRLVLNRLGVSDTLGDAARIIGLELEYT